jgi:uncharacterized protein YneF (UPF0154 family)
MKSKIQKLYTFADIISNLFIMKGIFVFIGFFLSLQLIEKQINENHIVCSQT